MRSSAMLRDPFLQVRCDAGVKNRIPFVRQNVHGSHLLRHVVILERGLGDRVASLAMTNESALAMTTEGALAVADGNGPVIAKPQAAAISEAPGFRIPGSR